MPPRYSYWTIIAGGLPTAFRAAKSDELLPTFKRIQQKHPDAQMMWFARGRLWSSPEDAMRNDERPAREVERGRDWRPGGSHQDPRQVFTDRKKRRNRDRRQQRWAAKQRSDQAEPHRDSLRQTVPVAPRRTAGSAASRDRTRPPRAASRGSGSPKSQTSSISKQQRPQNVAPRLTPHGDKLRDTVPTTRGRAHRPFRTRGVERARERGQQTEETPRVPAPPETPEYQPEPTPDRPTEPRPHPTEPIVPSPGPPERGRRKATERGRHQE
jgi:hypothetical protein